MPGAVTPRATVERARERLDVLIAEYRRNGRERLPPETELSAELGVSRNTLREALAQLEADGTIVRRRRVGTVIAPAPVVDERPTRSTYPIDEIVSIPDFFTSTGQPFRIDSVAVTQERADASIAESLGLAVGDDVYRVRRKYVTDAGPMAIGEHVLPTALRGHGINIEALTDGVSTFLAEVENIVISEVDHVVTAITAQPSLAAEFQVAVGAPLLAVDARLCTDDEGSAQPVAIGRLIFDSAKVAVRATGRATRNLETQPNV